MKEIHVAVFVGSLRKASYNLKIAKVLQQLSPSHIKLHIMDGLGQLPFYNEDLDNDTPPASWIAFRKKVSEFHATLFVTPEYNRSFPAALKNALDVGSRPYGKSIWSQKPTAVLSASVGAIGGFGANHHLRQSMVFLDMPCMQQPEAYLGNIASSFDTQGHITEGTKEFLAKYMAAYAQWLTHFIH